MRHEINALDSSPDLESEGGATKLAAKRVQLEQVVKKISSISDVDAESRGATEGEWKGLLARFAKAALAAVAPHMEAYAHEVATKIRPYCLNEANARALAFTMPACISLSQTYSRRFGDYGVTVTELKAAIARADEILAGELNWSFTPNSGK